MGFGSKCSILNGQVTYIKNQNWTLPTCDSFFLIMSHMWSVPSQEVICLLNWSFPKKHFFFLFFFLLFGCTSYHSKARLTNSFVETRCHILKQFYKISRDILTQDQYLLFFLQQDEEIINLKFIQDTIAILLDYITYVQQILLENNHFIRVQINVLNLNVINERATILSFLYNMVKQPKI